MQSTFTIGQGTKRAFARRLALFALVAIACPVKALPGEMESLFQEANQLYEQGLYQEAIDRYEKILSNGYENWQLYYNLGNAYFKTKQIGKAILNYERAKNLSPKNEDVIFNLQLANLSVVDKIATPPQFVVFKVLSDFKNFLSLNQLTFITLGVYSLIMLLLSVRILVRKRAIRALALRLIVPLAVAVVTLSIVLGVRIYENENIRYGIIMADKVDVMSSPSEDGTEVFSLHQGVKIRIQGVSDDWLEIRLADGKVGWVSNSTLEII